LKILQKNEIFQKALADIAFSDDVDEDVFEIVEKYVCSIYGKKSLESIDDVRTHIFLDKYRPKNENDRLACVKRLDGSMLPPCYKVLMMKIKRMLFVARQWVSCTSAHPPQEAPEEFGWKKKEIYTILWYEGDATPPILDVVCGNDECDSLSEGEEGMSISK